jgi:hypothetical protein
MGLVAVLKRLALRLFGREQTVACSCCGAGIRRSDFDEGRAAVVARVRYCPRCVQDVVRRKAGGVILESSSSSIHGPLLG